MARSKTIRELRRVMADVAEMQERAEMGVSVNWLELIKDLNRDDLRWMAAESFRRANARYVEAERVLAAAGASRKALNQVRKLADRARQLGAGSASS